MWQVHKEQQRVERATDFFDLVTSSGSMQALRSLVGKAGLLPTARRSMTTAAQIAADAKKASGSMVDTIGVYTVTPLAVAVFVYDIFIHPEEVRLSAIG